MKIAQKAHGPYGSQEYHILYTDFSSEGFKLTFEQALGRGKLYYKPCIQIAFNVLYIIKYIS